MSGRISKHTTTITGPTLDAIRTLLDLGNQQKHTLNHSTPTPVPHIVFMGQTLSDSYD